SSPLAASRDGQSSRMKTIAIVLLSALTIGTAFFAHFTPPNLRASASMPISKTKGRVQGCSRAASARILGVLRCHVLLFLSSPAHTPPPSSSQAHVSNDASGIGMTTPFPRVSGGLKRRSLLLRGLGACAAPFLAAYPASARDWQSVSTALLKIQAYKGQVKRTEHLLRYGAAHEKHATVVLRFVKSVLDPMQATMLSVATRLPVASRPEAVEDLALSMKAHMAELEAACESNNSEGQIAKMAEISGTLDKFLELSEAAQVAPPQQVINSS
ncbi:unnamed protein product, partial [Chrysoparadoxa australica]